MNAEERLKNWKIHPSMRGQFAYQLYKLMALDKDIILLTGDLGFGMFDAHKEDFKERFINCGASEQSMLGISIGLALSKKIPVVYSITPFLLYRPFETIKLYINEEKIPVKLIGGGRNKDYVHDGPSHDATDAPTILNTLKNIKQYFPKEELDLKEILYNDSPCFLSLRR
jgi:transketolase